MQSKSCSHVADIGGKEYRLESRSEGEKGEKELVSGTGCIRKALVTGGDCMRSKEKEYKIASHWVCHKSWALAVTAAEEN